MSEPAVTGALRAAFTPFRWQIMFGSWYSVGASKPRSVAVVAQPMLCGGEVIYGYLSAM